MRKSYSRKSYSWTAVVVLLVACSKDPEAVCPPGYTCAPMDGAVIDLGDVKAEMQPNRPPVAGDDSAETFAGQEVEIDVRDNDGDPDGDSLDITEFTQGDHGLVEVSLNNIVYTPNDAIYVGTDTFTYTVDDGNGGTDEADVTVNIVEAPTLIILTPLDNEAFPPGTDTVNVMFDVTGCNFIAPSGDPAGCHAHRYLDGAPLAAGLGIYTESAFDLTGLLPGEHMFRLALARNDGTDALWAPAIEDTVTFTVEFPPDAGPDL